MPLSDRLKKLPKQIKPNPTLLLHPNVPKPLHGTAPRVVLGSNWWDRERRACYKAALDCCEACGVHKSRAKSRQWVEAHETYEIDYRKGRAKYIRSVSLCHFCHNFIHDGRLQALLEQGKIPHGKYRDILQHGEEILVRAGLARPSHAERETRIAEMVTNGQVAKWEDWRLQIGRKLYLPVYPTEADWIRAYSVSMSNDS